MRLTVVICTHNRARLLEQTIASLNRASRPDLCAVNLLVVLNACTDSSERYLNDYLEKRVPCDWLPLTWVKEATPGKSHALNRAISMIDADLVAMVDDDHRVDESYLVSVCKAAHDNPEATMLCGRILPDWDGREPRWVHDTGPYRIYPLPVPRQDFGDDAHEIGIDGPIPGGGNQILRRAVFERVGAFALDLGPQGHDLGGGEDTEFMLRALRKGERLVYEPTISQYHYVEPLRFKLDYLIRKAYHRSRASVRLTRSAGFGVPLYAWRKLIGYIAAALFSVSWARRRFFLVRTAASLGEISAMRAANRRLPTARGLADVAPVWTKLLALGGALLAFIGLMHSRSLGDAWLGASVVVGVAGAISLIVLASSVANFSRTGPNLRADILAHYRRYTLFALGRLTFWAWLLCALMAGVGVTLYFCACITFDLPVRPWGLVAASLAGIAAVLGVQFCRQLLVLPASICASLNFLPSRLYGLWRHLSATRIDTFVTIALVVAIAVILSSTARLAGEADFTTMAVILGIVALYSGLVAWAMWNRETPPSRAVSRPTKPNILMIGSDTLRADRLGILGYRRNLTPNLDALATRGMTFSQCFVPCARTAPSLLSLLTGTWPHRHGVRDNFVADSETRLTVPGLPVILKDHEYVTAAVSDWCGGDLRKFPLGFDYLDLPSDQWNIKYLIRQGPKNLRLMLSLFTHNRFGKTFLPELSFLAGVPMTREIGRRGRRVISALAQTDRPFFLNLFLSTTHPPFGSEYPYYTLFSDPDYRGESKFVMARLTDPFDIIRRQGQPKEDFDLNQILDLYDGCVSNFDDEVGRILEFLRASGLDKDTIVVIYSDHGMEFFEHGTWGQGNSAIGDFSARVPLLIHDPRIATSGIMDGVVRSIDVAPTLLDLAGIPTPGSMDGVSLAATLSDPARCPDLDAFYETGIWITDIPGLPDGHLRYPNLLELLEVPDRDSGTLALKAQYAGITVAAKDRMIRSAGWKLVYQPLVDGYSLQLFDVESDPMCKTNVAAAHPEITEALWRKMEAWLNDS